MHALGVVSSQYGTEIQTLNKHLDVNPISAQFGIEIKRLGQFEHNAVNTPVARQIRVRTMCGERC